MFHLQFLNYEKFCIYLPIYLFIIYLYHLNFPLCVKIVFLKLCKNTGIQYSDYLCLNRMNIEVFLSQIFVMFYFIPLNNLLFIVIETLSVI